MVIGWLNAYIYLVTLPACRHRNLATMFAHKLMLTVRSTHVMWRADPEDLPIWEREAAEEMARRRADEAELVSWSYVIPTDRPWPDESSGFTISKIVEGHPSRRPCVAFVREWFVCLFVF